MTRVCRVPGCEAILSKRNRSGVCAGHAHAKFWCGCSYCAKYTGFQPAVFKPGLVEPLDPARPRVSDRPDVKVVEVAAACGVSSSADRPQRISLAAAPWEMGA